MRTQRGYSLLEVVVAFAVLMFVITVSMLAFLERNRRLQQANELIRAYQSMANEAELLRRYPYDDVVSTTSFASATDVLEPLAPFTTAVEVVTKVGRKDVTLIVHWGDGRRGGPKEAKLGLVRTKTGGTNLW